VRQAGPIWNHGFLLIICSLAFHSAARYLLHACQLRTEISEHSRTRTISREQHQVIQFRGQEIFIEHSREMLGMPPTSIKNSQKPNLSAGAYAVRVKLQVVES
jgi:hypothetical protein